MRRISYGGASFLTTESVSDALLPLFVALGTSHMTQALATPAVNAEGETVIVKLVANPTMTSSASTKTHSGMNPTPQQRSPTSSPSPKPSSQPRHRRPPETRSPSLISTSTTRATPKLRRPGIRRPFTTIRRL